MPEITVQAPLGRELVHQPQLKRLLEHGVTWIKPASPELEQFHAFLLPHFQPGEVEPIEKFSEELSQPSDAVQFAGALITDPDRNHAVVSVAYGSAQRNLCAI